MKAIQMAKMDLYNSLLDKFMQKKTILLLYK